MSLATISIVLCLVLMVATVLCLYIVCHRLISKKRSLESEIRIIYEEKNNINIKLLKYKTLYEKLIATIQILKEKYELEKSKIQILEKHKKILSNKVVNLKTIISHTNQIILRHEESSRELATIQKKIKSISKLESEADSKILQIKSKVDLYSRIDDFVDFGLYEQPDYLYETSERFAAEIKKIRQLQRQMISDDKIITISGRLAADASYDFIQKVLTVQARQVVRSFNIECDHIIGKVNSGNIERTLKRINEICSSLERDIIDLRFGFNTDYVKLKYDECNLQYQFRLKQKEEQEEQRALRERMREEEKAQKEYDKAIFEAKNEEELYQSLLEKAKLELELASNEEKKATELRIIQLENEVAEAKAKSERALSMAQQTRQGYVYIISNIGSFGEDVYKIGLTRRLDPMERVKELGDASVPFSFDVHAFITAEDAPGLESALHKAFEDRRVNAVNFRKEFFHVSLEDIKSKVCELTGDDHNFVMTVLAEEYYESRRLRRHAEG